MSYVTEPDLIDRFGEDTLIQLTDRENDQIVDSAITTVAITDAENTINSYLQSRYTLPLAQTLIDGSPLKRIAGDIAVFYLYANGAPEHIEKNYDKGIAWLRDIKNGKASLGPDDTTTTPSTTRMVTAHGKSNFNFEAY